jgi:murein DD-endopeptidase MepM/ murein hydrolase activator NlpD
VTGLTNRQSSPLVRERRRWKILRLIFRSDRLGLIAAALFLALLVAGPYWYASRKHLPDFISAPPKEFMVSIALNASPFQEIIGNFRPNQTITQALTQHGLPSPLINEIVDCARPIYNLAKVKAAQVYRLCITQEGKFRSFRYPMDDQRYLAVYRDDQQDRLVSVVKQFPFDTRVESVSATIDSSLFASIESIGEKDQLALDMADIFGSDIDFNIDIQKGDSFRALVEKRYLDEKFSGYGAILAADFSNGKKKYLGFRFTDENGKPAYYGQDGKALKKSFLKSPLKFTRITSKFSFSRLHPILKILRPHLGVDYAAPVGTPVHAVGSGVVLNAGWSGGSGRVVSLRHSGGYETMYLHLSRIVVKRGARVGQGDVIGYVGSSGLSTGPHLDFRTFRHGQPINPLKIVFPPGDPVSRAKFDQFASIRDNLITKLRITN